MSLPHLVLSFYMIATSLNTPIPSNHQLVFICTSSRCVSCLLVSDLAMFGGILWRFLFFLRWNCRCLNVCNGVGYILSRGVSILVLSCLVLSCLVLSCLVLSCLVLSAIQPVSQPACQTVSQPTSLPASLPAEQPGSGGTQMHQSQDGARGCVR